MLALVLTLILAIYILGPDVLSRFIVSLFAPARARKLNRSEEVARAIVMSAIPLSIIFAIMHLGFNRFSNMLVLKDFLLGLYGEKSLEDHSDQFFVAASTVIRLNLLFLVLPLYSLVVCWSVTLVLLIKNYGKLLRKFEKSPKSRNTLNWIVRPWAAEWHLKLSQDLLPTKDHYIRVDVLTKLDVLFRGTLTEHHMASDGSLVSITLTDPQKFKRVELLEARAGSTIIKPDPSRFWSPIEARFFVIMASEIVTLNLNYVDPKSLKRTPRNLSKFFADQALAAVNRNRAIRGGQPLPRRAP